MKRLIINADDLGMTAGINRGIERACREGVVRSATLMAAGAAFDDAVAVAQRTPELSIGCHVVLIGGRPILPPTQAPSLAPAGEFRPGIAAFTQAAVFGKLNASEIRAEVEAQIQKLQRAGVTLTHVDSHKHTHIFPAVLRPLLEAARDCGIRAVRNPFTPVRLLAAQLLRPSRFARGSKVMLLSAFRASFGRELRRTGMRSPDGSFGIVATGSLGAATLARIAAAIPEGTWELVTHPGYNDAELERLPTRLRQSRDVELELLCSPETRKALEQHGVTVISYREFLESSSVR